LLHTDFIWWGASALLAFALGVLLTRRHYRAVIALLENPDIDQVRWCYRSLLFREPENDSMVAFWVSQGLSFDNLCAEFTTSAEFKLLSPERQTQAHANLADRRGNDLQPLRAAPPLQSA
jgi:hypothetical protein